MASTIQNTIPKIVSARLLRGFERRTLWGGLITNASQELASAGDSVDFGRITTAITVGDYEQHTDISAQKLADEKVTLSVDKSKYFSINVDDVERQEARPNIMDEGTRKAANAMAWQFDDDVSAVVQGVTVDSSGNDRNADSTKNITSTSNDEALNGFLGQLIETAGYLRGRNWDGIRCVIPSDISTLLTKHLVINGIGAVNAAEGPWRNGAVSQVVGIPVDVDNQLPTAAATGRKMATFLNPDCARYAMTIQRVETLRHPTQFVTNVRGLWHYGAAVTDPSKIFYVVQSA